jgi:hypothetical protein
MTRIWLALFMAAAVVPAGAQQKPPATLTRTRSLPAARRPTSGSWRALIS